MVDNTQMDVEFKIFADVWKLLKTNYIPENTDEYWSRLAEESKQISKKYSSDLCNDLLIVILNNQERRVKKENAIT